jgi:hypothetical protein
LTNVSIFELRKKFIQTFTSQGSISEAYTSQTQSMTTGEPAPAVQTPPAAPVAPTSSEALEAKGLAGNEAMKLEEARANAPKSPREASGKLDKQTPSNKPVTSNAINAESILNQLEGLK